MTRVFMDSSVIFSAAYSARGHARDLLMSAVKGGVELVVSPTVLEETRRNLSESAPQTLPFLELVMASIAPEMSRPTRAEVLGAAEHVALKDAPIAAAAKKAGVAMLVTLDKKHLLGRPDLARYVGADIVTPKQAMARLAQRG